MELNIWTSSMKAQVVDVLLRSLDRDNKDKWEVTFRYEREKLIFHSAEYKKDKQFEFTLGSLWRWPMRIGFRDYKDAPPDNFMTLALWPWDLAVKRLRRMIAKQAALGLSKTRHEWDDALTRVREDLGELREVDGDTGS